MQAGAPEAFSGDSPKCEGLMLDRGHPLKARCAAGYSVSTVSKPHRTLQGKPCAVLEMRT